jgi:hypothetical protein
MIVTFDRPAADAVGSWIPKTQANILTIPCHRMGLAENAGAGKRI